MGKNPNRVRAGRSLSNMRWARTCQHCGKKFQGTYRQIYCSRKCKETHDLSPNRFGKHCPTCGKPITPVPTGRNKKYCNDRCKQMMRAPVHNKICPICKHPFTIRGKGAARKRYCDPLCKKIAASKKRYLKINPAIHLAITRGALHERFDHP